MANARAFTPIDMLTRPVWFGTLLQSTSSLIVINDGFRQAEYRGQFSYNAFGEVFGTLRSYRELEGRKLVIEYDTLNVDMNEIFNKIQVEANFFGASRAALDGDDNVRGSAGDDRLYAFAGDDEMDGFGGSDILVGGAGDDVMRGGAGDDRLYGEAGINTLSGGAGSDAAFFEFAYDDYDVENRSSEGLRVRETSGKRAAEEETAVRSDIETIIFSDRSFSFAELVAEIDSENSSQRASSQSDVQAIALLYEAGLGRPAAYLGLNFWIDRFEAGNPLSQIAQSFLDSSEFERNVGDPGDLSNSDLISGLFNNVIGRPAAEAGLDFWTGRLEDGVPRAELLLVFATSPENAAKSPEVRTLQPIGDADGGERDPNDVLQEDIFPEWDFGV